MRAIYLLLLLPPALLAQPGAESLAGLLAHPREDSALWHRQVGIAFYKVGKIEPTVEHLQKAIRLEPSNEQYYLDLGEVLSQNNAREAVVVVIEAARKAVGESFRIRSALGVAYLSIRNYERAREVFTGLVKEKPDDEMAYQLLAECYDITRDWENTAKVAENLRALNSRNSNGWYYGAEAEYGIRRPEGESLKTAELYVRRAMELAPGDWRPHLLLGKVLSDSNRDREAIGELRKAIALKSGDPKTYYILGQALKRLGRDKESAEAFAAYKEVRERHAAGQRTLLVDIK